MTISIEAEGKETSRWEGRYINFVEWHKDMDRTLDR
jgi:hypothetical protein